RKERRQIRTKEIKTKKTLSNKKVGT
ncbi:hypothetical protein HMPREF9628_02021, partial [Peptoanaerobacter stomatis]